MFSTIIQTNENLKTVIIIRRVMGVRNKCE